MGPYLAIFIGGGLGSVARYQIGVWFGRLFGLGFPFATLTVNIVGGFVMGLFTEWLLARLGGSLLLRQFFAVGVLGGFTTFSSFTLDLAILWERGAQGLAVLYGVASVAGAIIALFSGLAIGRLLSAG